MRSATQVLALLGWRIKTDFPDTKKYVLIVAPHTSNWDFPLGLLASWAMGLGANWMGKHTLFRPPFGSLLRALGGVPVNRSESVNLIDQMRDRFARADRMILALAPDGTRSKAGYWKSGFYHIATAAQVPIVMAYMDYGQKEIGLGGAFLPTGNQNADMQCVSAFFANRRGKNRDQESLIRLREPRGRSELPVATGPDQAKPAQQQHQ